MERGAAGGGGAAASGHGYIVADEHLTGKSSFDNPATKKKPPKLKSMNRSISMAIDDDMGLGLGMGMVMGGSSPTQLMFHEQHRSVSPQRSAPPPQTLALPPMHVGGAAGGGCGDTVSPAMSARQQHHLRTFQHLARHHSQYLSRHPHHSSSMSSPTSHAVSPVPPTQSSSSTQHHHQYQHQPDIYYVGGSLGDNIGVGGGGGGSGGGAGGSSPIRFIDDYMLPPVASSATHPLKKSMFRRSDTIDVHPASTFQMKKTHSFHAQQEPAVTIDQVALLATSANVQQLAAGGSTTSSRRTSSVRGNFLMPSGHPGGKEVVSRSPSPSRRGYRAHRSFNDPTRRPSPKPESVVESQIRHPSLNDDLIESMDGRPALFTQPNLSLENELFVESRSRSNSHTKMEDVGMVDMAPIVRAAVAAPSMVRKSSGSFEEGPVGSHSASTHPPTATNSVKKRGDHPHSRQHSSQSLELDTRPSTSAAAAQLHSAAAAAQAAYHFKRGAQHGRSLYLSPNNLEELPVHRPGVIAAAAAFQGTNASAKQAKALHSASMRLRTYRETLSASKKSKSFIGDGAYPPATQEFELTSPHRRNSRPLSGTVVGTGPGGAVTIEDIKRSPRPLALTPTTAAAATAFMEEKRPSFERKSSITYELGDAAFEQVLRPFHHKVAAGRKASTSGSHKGLKKKSLSDETDDGEEADRKRKRIVCIVMTVFLCLVCASVFVVVVTLTHSSGQSTHTTHQTHKKIYTFSRETPVHYNVRQENERLMKETMDRARFGKNYTDTAPLVASATQHLQQSAPPISAASSTSLISTGMGVSVGVGAASTAGASQPAFGAALAQDGIASSSSSEVLHVSSVGDEVNVVASSSALIVP